MTTAFLHGVEVVQIDAGPRPIQTVASAVIGIIGTAPGSQPEVKATLTTGSAAGNNGVTYTSKLAGALGNKSSLTLADPKANSAALSVVVNGLDIVVSLATSAGGAITTTAAQLLTAIAGSAPANALVGAVNTGASSGASAVAATGKQYLSGGIDEAFPLNTPVLVAGSRVDAAKLGATGTLPDALDSIFDQAGALVVVVRVAQVGASDTDVGTIANVIGGTNGVSGKYEGMQAFLGAEAATGVSPKILCAPGFTNARTAGPNTVVSNMVSIADRLRAVIVADGPSTTDADALAYAGDFGSKRVFLVDPFVIKSDNNGITYRAPASAHVAGLIAKTDNEEGFWVSPSNHELFGINGTDRAIDFTLGDPNARANVLNGKNIAVIIRNSGFRLWGNRTLSSDPKWAFLSVVRTADIINESIQRAARVAVDKAITKQFFEYVTEEVNAYLRSLTAIGAILGGKCYYDKDLNTPDQLAQGNTYFDFDFTAPAPAEHITFRSHLVSDYYKNVFA